MATSMIGFPNACTFNYDFGIKSDLVLGTEYATTGDQFAWTCGYYVEVEWSGYSGVHIEVWTLNGLTNVLSAFAILATGSLLL